MRTTLDIDDPLLRDLKKLQQRERKTLGRLVSDLLAQALAARELDGGGRTPAFTWNVARGALLVDIRDKDALAGALEEGGGLRGPGIDPPGVARKDRRKRP